MYYYWIFMKQTLVVKWPPTSIISSDLLKNTRKLGILEFVRLPMVIKTLNSFTVFCFDCPFWRGFSWMDKWLDNSLFFDWFKNVRRFLILSLGDHQSKVIIKVSQVESTTRFHFDCCQFLGENKNKNFEWCYNGHELNLWKWRD